MAFEHRLGIRISLLQLDVPIFELLERDGHAGDRTTHEAARLDDAEIPVEVFHLRLACHGTGPIVAVEHVRPPLRVPSTRGSRPKASAATCRNIVTVTRSRKSPGPTCGPWHAPSSEQIPLVRADCAAAATPSQRSGGRLPRLPGFGYRSDVPVREF